LDIAFDEVGFSADYVLACIRAAEAGTAQRKTKHIKDNVWGMVEFDGAAMRLLDCPIVQRLRGIKQLGFSYLTYPSAEHSRFIHSLGMACVVSRMLDSIAKRADENRDEHEGNDYVGLEPLKPLTREDIVHSAILHDVGHMPFSHATETVLAGREDDFLCGNMTVANFTGLVERRLSKSLKLAEALSLLVILSKRFSQFYDRYVRYGSEDRDSLLRIACLIAGLPPEPRLSGVAELISASVVDADKIDYVNRDAYSCGIPVSVDVSRIFLRSGFLKVGREQLLRSNLKDDPAAEEILFVVNASGLDTIDEITQARAALYQRVYLHAVTRTAESVYAGALEANALSANRHPTFADALGLWSVSDYALLPALVHSQDPDVALRSRKLRNRDLPKKACVFSSSIANMHMPLQSLLPRLPSSEAAAIRKQVVNTPLESLTAKKISSGVGRLLTAEIREELTRLVAIISEEKRFDLIPQAPLDLLELIGSAYMDRVQVDCIVLQNGELLRTSQFTNIREQQDAFDIFKAVGFVMCDPAWRPLVLVAARTVLCNRTSKLQMTALFETRSTSDTGPDQSDPPEAVYFITRMILDLQGVIRRSGINRGKVMAIVEAATEAGYFDDKPLLAQPIDPESAEVRQVSDKLHKFDGQRSWQVRNESAAAFLNQFPPRLRSSMFKMLSEKLVYFDRTEIGSSLISTVRGLGPIDVVPLSPNSGNFSRMIFEDAARGKEAFATIRFRSAITNALSENTEQALVLVDDNISSATQARAQFLQWAGVPRANWPPECQEEDGIFETVLPGDMLERMRSRPIYVGVCAGRDAANENLKQTARELGFAKFEAVRFNHPIEQLSGWPEDLREFLKDVGFSIMAWARYRKTPDQLTLEESQYCEARAFGYGNVGGLVATGLNVPTATVTALWCPGIYKRSPWMPLMIRRNKLRHLVIG
jgi:HD superfamily phosphohydrolase